ncbi:SOSS complex subunit C isoform X2 [Corythoichthys intestinalis]|uniref:SOSS complex subunit C isoform X2 n=1 Tax=Corythoichthys intestinalis TaxID=161448 RepID=UPI0025A66955|nr:SOSS complex subunit C isoform X2 [Corythoichthys intestinalis]
MAANPSGPVFQNKARVQILAELEKERKRLIQNQSVSTPGARTSGIVQSNSISSPSRKQPCSMHTHTRQASSSLRTHHLVTSFSLCCHAWRLSHDLFTRDVCTYAHV